MTYLLTISTKRLFRKPFIEIIKGAWKDEAEVRRVAAKFRPKAEILNIEEIQVIHSCEKAGDKP